MKTRSAWVAAASLTMAMLVPAGAFAHTDEDKDDGGAKKVKTIKIVSLGGDAHGFLGVGVADVEEDRAKDIGLREDYGVEVKSVVKDSAAAKAGVKKGDVVLEYNGTRVESTAQFIRMVRETRVGRQIRLQVFRDGHTTTLTGSMEKRQPQVFRWKSKGNDSEVYNLDMPEPPEPPEPPEAGDMDDDDVTVTVPDIDIQIPDIPSPTMSWKTPRLGVETEAIGPQLAEFFGVKDGVLVRAVIKDSAAEKAGVKAGDVIVKIGGEEVSRPGDISSVLRSADASDLSIVVVRNRREVTLTAKVDSRARGARSPRRRSSLFSAPTPEPEPDADAEDENDEDTDNR